jgi:2'-5' RNA ligase
MTLCHRLFYALRPPEGAVDYIMEEQRRFGPGWGIRQEHLHVTLAMANDHAMFPTPLADRMLAVGDRIAADPFRFILNQVAASRRSVAMRPSKALSQLGHFQRQLDIGMTMAGIAARAGWRFSPHLTLLYRHGRPFSRWIDAVSWTVTDFVLIHSLVGLTRHEDLGRWRLGSSSPTLH